MSGMMLHGLGDCTPELNCGCMVKSPRDVLRERIALALWEHRYPGMEQTGPLADLALTDADAVVAALRLEEESRSNLVGAMGQIPYAVHRRRYVTPWERIEDEDTP